MISTFFDWLMFDLAGLEADKSFPSCGADSKSPRRCSCGGAIAFCSATLMVGRWQLGGRGGRARVGKDFPKGGAGTNFNGGCPANGAARPGADVEDGVSCVPHADTVRALLLALRPGTRRVRPPRARRGRRGLRRRRTPSRGGRRRRRGADEDAAGSGAFAVRAMAWIESGSRAAIHAKPSPWTSA